MTTEMDWNMKQQLIEGLCALEQHILGRIADTQC